MANRLFRILAAALFAISLLVLIIVTNVRLLILDPDVYLSIQVTNGVLVSSGLPESTLRAADTSLAAYFGRKEASLDAELKRQGLPSDFFNARESDHLADVKDLIWRAIALQQMALGYVALFLVAAFLLGPKRFLSRVRAPLLWGAGLTLALLVVFGVLSQIDFSGLWLLFHFISFTNDLWMLDPSTDNLLKMAPEVVWLNGTIMVGVYSAAEALGIGAVVALLYWRWPGARQSN